MGRGRYIYIQDNIDERLQKEANKSKLINDLLAEHYEKTEFLNMDAKQLRAEMEVRKLEKETQAKIKDIRKNGN